jgi:hypothetical protein
VFDVQPLLQRAVCCSQSPPSWWGNLVESVQRAVAGVNQALSCQLVSIVSIIVCSLLCCLLSLRQRHPTSWARANEKTVFALLCYDRLRSSPSVASPAHHIYNTHVLRVTFTLVGWCSRSHSLTLPHLLVRFWPRSLSKNVTTSTVQDKYLLLEGTTSVLQAWARITRLLKDSYSGLLLVRRLLS